MQKFRKINIQLDESGNIYKNKQFFQLIKF